MTKMSEGEIQARMPEVEGWSRLGDMLVRSWRFSSSRRAVEFVNQLAEMADRASHYPEIVLRYRDVRVELATHDAGGLTPSDFDFAKAVNSLPSDR